MNKSRDAFRTISEVAEWLDTPAHVLRFWESKFSQIKPVKRAGGRRYYRPDDMELLGGIKTLLHNQGMTIKGVQKLLRENGIKHVAALGPSPMDTAPVEARPRAEPRMPPRATDAPPAETPDANVVPMAASTASAPPEPAPPADSVAPAEPGNAAKRAAVAAFLRDLPKDPGDDDQDIPGRFHAKFARADRDRLVAKAARIAPLAARLAAVRAHIARD
jgi:DNA-binding transcriptional MerR regulator